MKNLPKCEEVWYMLNDLLYALSVQEVQWLHLPNYPICIKHDMSLILLPWYWTYIGSPETPATTTLIIKTCPQLQDRKGLQVGESHSYTYVI